MQTLVRMSFSAGKTAHRPTTGMCKPTSRCVSHQPVLELLYQDDWALCSAIMLVLVQATNVDFANRLYGAPEITASKRFSKPKLSQTGFAIEHYAGGVGYKTDNFLVKNKDFVVAEHQQLMQNSDQPFVRMLFPAEAEPAADGNKVQSPYIHASHRAMCWTCYYT